MRLQEHVQTGPSCDRHKGGFLVFYLRKASQIHVRNRRNIYTRDSAIDGSRSVKSLKY